LALAEHARASTEIGLFVLVQLFRAGRVRQFSRVMLRWEFCDAGFLDVRDSRWGWLEIEAGRTILASPRAVTIHRAWMSP
jgi:hypothetical protein